MNQHEINILYMNQYVFPHRPTHPPTNQLTHQPSHPPTNQPDPDPDHLSFF